MLLLAAAPSPAAAAADSSQLVTPNSTLVRLTEYPEALCLDGTPAGYYWRPGSGDGATKWYIHHEGGGWCQMETPLQNWPNDNCLDRANNSNPTAWLARLGTLTADPPSQVWDVAYSSAPDPAINPLMHNWNSVYLRYCDGGTFTGDSTTTANGVTQGAGDRYRGFSGFT